MRKPTVTHDQQPAPRDDYLIAKALFMAINAYALYPGEMRPKADTADMRRILHEEYPAYAQAFEGLADTVRVH